MTGSSGTWLLGLLVLLLIASILAMPWTAPLFHAWFPDLQRPVYTRASFLDLFLSHAGIVVVAVIGFVAIGLSVGISVTRPSGRAFAGVVDAVTAVGQTFPPAAVLALAVPMIGYGAAPTILALVAYGTLPVVECTIRGLRGVAADVKEAADGAGFSAIRCLLSVELPLAAQVILSGVRTSTIIAIGTATIGSTVGALTLGSPIIEGLSGSNPAYVIQGSIVVGLFAVCTDLAFDQCEQWLRVRTGGGR
jgi:osmoprotectant transport system permease protein